jgi:hypothetical protein
LIRPENGVALKYHLDHLDKWGMKDYWSTLCTALIAKHDIAKAEKV